MWVYVRTELFARGAYGFTRGGHMAKKNRKFSFGPQLAFFTIQFRR